METRLVPIFARVLAEKEGLTEPNLTFRNLAQRAITKIQLTDAREIVCGPITTGGTGDPGLNALLFNHAIELLELEGRRMFNQIPFEYRLAQLETKWKEGNGGYCRPILEEFYRPIFESGYLDCAWFLPGWEASTGAKWEHELLSRLEYEIEYLPERWLYTLDVRRR